MVLYGEPDRLAWVLTGLPGKSYADHLPKTTPLIGELGRVLGETAKVFETFSHSYLDRDFKWNLMQAAWIRSHTDCLADPSRRDIVDGIIRGFEAIETDLGALPRQAIYNDGNDYNILVSGGLDTPAQISGLIDLGDMCLAPRICDLAIAAAYIVLNL